MMKLALLGFTLCFIVCYAWQGQYNYTCKFRLPDGEIYDISKLKRDKIPDYTYKEGEYLFVMNLCRPAHKICDGIEGPFVSIWNATSYRCLTTSAEYEPSVSYLDDNNKYKGIKLTFYYGMTSTVIEISCDQAFTRTALIKAEKVNWEYHFYMKSNQVCRNYAHVETDGWSPVAILLIVILLIVLCYFGVAQCISAKRGNYPAISDFIAKNECLLGFALNVKNCINKVIGQVAPNTELDEVNTSVSTTPASSHS